MKRSRLLALILIALSGESAAQERKEDLVAYYTFDDVGDGTASDSSGHALRGSVIGDLKLAPGKLGQALELDGVGRVQVNLLQSKGMSDLFDLRRSFTLSAWVRGRGSEFRIVYPSTGASSARGPDFQIVGDKIHFTYNSDDRSTVNPNRHSNQESPWDQWHVWTGSADINLTGWKDIQRTSNPMSGVEPKLVVHAGRVFYEYFGQNTDGVWQIYTAQSDTDGQQWQSMQRTFETEGYRVEQLYNLQVADDSIFYAWQQRDKAGQWQTWTAHSNLDGTEFLARQQTVTGGGIPQLQVVGNKIFYYYPAHRAGHDPHLRYRVLDQTFAVANLDGTGWRVLRTLGEASSSGGKAGFQVHKGRIYFAYSRLMPDGHSRLFTGSMTTEGADLRVRQRSSGEHSAAISFGGRGIQVLGEKMYVAYTLDESGMTESARRLGEASGKGPDQLNAIYLGVCDLDGQNWRSEPLSAPLSNLLLGYQALQMIGGKAYFAAFSPPLPVNGRPSDRYRSFIATNGSNIISKGDAFGIGLDGSNFASGFLNAGQGYLYEGTAPSETAGVVVGKNINNDWHHLVATFNGTDLKFYIDGDLVDRKSTSQVPRRNPFPLIIGDGFRGLIDEVRIYSRAADGDEVRGWYLESR